MDTQIFEKACTIHFSNKHAEIVISKENGILLSLINKKTQKDVKKEEEPCEFVYLFNKDRFNPEKILPKSLELKDGILISHFDDTDVLIKSEVFDEFFTFEVISSVPKTYSGLVFAHLETNEPYSEDPDSFRLDAIGMSAHTNPKNFGFGNYRQTIAYTYPRFPEGTMGAKLGVVFSSLDVHLDLLKELTLKIDPKVGIVSKNAGAFARDCKKNFGDYILTRHAHKEEAEAMADLALSVGVDQIDILQCYVNTFRQGDFRFMTVPSGTPAEFEKEVGSIFRKRGLITSLHTYAYYIDKTAEEILANPKWQKDLETAETYTLAKDISETDTQIFTEESAADFNLIQSFFVHNSCSVIVDEEIILINKVSDEGFVQVVRAQGGTKAAPHKKGAVIKHMLGLFNMYSPIVGSPLFFHIADLTAKSYNEGGFDMIYMDAIDGLNRHVPEEDIWYWFQMFTHRITSKCVRDPIFEFSSEAPQMWNARGRAGAWDTVHQGFRQFTDRHIKKNLENQENNFVTTLGWYFFLTDCDNMLLRNTVCKTLFKNDIDYLGYQAVVHNMTIVYNPFELNLFEQFPELEENSRYYNRYYSIPRKSDYFSEETKKKVLASPYEFKIIEKGKNEWAFLERHYESAKLDPNSSYEYSGKNPFEKQSPYIRIEARYSTESNAPRVLAKFDENTDIMLQERVREMESFDMSSRMAMKVMVKGTGKDDDALLISLRSGFRRGESGGHSDYFIPLNFTGWKEHILVDTDNGEYDSVKFPFEHLQKDGPDYRTFRVYPNYEDIISLTVYACGECKGAKIGDVTTYEHSSAPIKNPTITCGSQSIVFKTTISGGDAIEYDPETNTASVHRQDMSREQIDFEGSISVDKGDFTLEFNTENTTSAPARVKVVAGFSGKEINN